jgi:glycosyltransferase involved in cell wall biosynthesis
MRSGSPRLVIFGPLPPPESGVEGITALLLNCLATGSSDQRTHTLQYRHFDTTVSSNISEREHFSWRKVRVVLRQMLGSIRLALESDAAYYPISQNTTGLLRDLALIWPLWLLRRQRLIHLHGGELQAVIRQQPAPLRAALRRVFGGERTFGIALTQSLKPCLEALLPAARIFVVPNAVAAPAVPRRATADRPLQVLFLSAVMERKGYRELARAVEELDGRGVAVELTLAGNPYLPGDRDYLTTLANASSIRIAGHLTDEAKWRALHAADVLALPSVAPEGQPLAILEGMAAGCAIVATDRGGIRDTVGDDEGFVMRPARGADLQANLARVLGELASNRPLLEQMRRAARARYERDFRPERFVDNWLGIVNEVLTPSGARDTR